MNIWWKNIILNGVRFSFIIGCLLNSHVFVRSLIHFYSSSYTSICLFILKRWLYFICFLEDCIYLFLPRGEGREKERERKIDVRNIDWLPLTYPNWGPILQPTHVPWLGIEPVTFQFAGWHSIHWDTPARASSIYLDSHCHPALTYVPGTVTVTGKHRKTEEYFQFN